MVKENERKRESRETGGLRECDVRQCPSEEEKGKAAEGKESRVSEEEKEGKDATEKKDRGKQLSGN